MSLSSGPPYFSARSRQRLAQTSTAAPSSAGPLVVERVRSGWLLAPDLKVTEVNRETSTLAGAYGGWITDNTFLIGGGAYWLTNGSSEREMAYGGFVFEWLARTDRLLGFGVRGLLGGGRATVGATFGELGFARTVRPTRRNERRDRNDLDTVDRETSRVAVREDFLIAEPQANLLVNFTDRLRLSVGVGYRLIGAANLVDDRLSGATGSLALQWGGGASR